MYKKAKKILKIFFSIFLIIIFIRTILSHSYENNQHNINTSGNSIYISKDGHQEIVFDKNGNAVQDITNMGSYNFKHPIEEPFGHFYYDTLPWIMWGNDKYDPSSKIQRIVAFIKDFGEGFLFTISINIVFFALLTPLLILIILKKDNKIIYSYLLFFIIFFILKFLFQILLIMTIFSCPSINPQDCLGYFIKSRFLGGLISLIISSIIGYYIFKKYDFYLDKILKLITIKKNNMNL